MEEGRSGALIALKVVLVWASLAVLAICLTALFLSMRAVMDIGGMCAEGGPYEISNSCPKGAVWMTPVSIWVGLAAAGAYVFAGRGLPGPKWISLAWPALFLSLGWNFWEYGLDPPDGGDGVVVGWIVCGVLFVVMGAVPLIGVLTTKPGRKWLMWSDAPTASGRSTFRDAKSAVSSVDWRNLGVAAGMYRDAPGATSSSDPGFDRDGDRDDGSYDDGDPNDVTSRLERLAAMYRRGDLSRTEFDAAKSQLLSDGRR